MAGRPTAREEIGVKVFLESFPASVRDQAKGLATYRLPRSRGSRYRCFAFIAPKPDHVGIEHVIFLATRYPWLQGTGSQKVSRGTSRID